ncbi:MAG: hypothetical protein AAGI38_17765 [Bacteroidota bacterium]
MADKTPNANPQASKLDAIRDIIFGEQIQDYDARFSELNQELTQKHDNLNTRVEELEKRLQTAIDRLGESLANQMTAQHEQLMLEVQRLEHEKAKRVELGQLLIRMGQQLMDEEKATS